jgi:nucleoside 2-deoxyribosyltransferase
LAAAAVLEQRGWSVFLPHRDVSAWGERDITPGEVAQECLEAVISSDAVIALMGESFGTHVEVGAAVGAGIPTVVVRSDASTESFFASGVASTSFVAELIVDDLDDIPQAIDGGGFEEALQLSRHRAIEPVRRHVP